MMCKYVNFSYLDFRARIRAVNQNPRQILVSNIILIGIKVLTIDYATSYYQWLLSNRRIPIYLLRRRFGGGEEVSRGTLRRVDTKSVF